MARYGMISAALLGALILSGCTSAAPDSSAPVVTAPSSATAGVAAGAPSGYSDAEPAEVFVPAIGARSSLIPVGLQPDGQMEVPDVHQPQQAAWFTGSVRPGQVGPAVVVGHVNGDHKPGIFVDLDKLSAGDAVIVTRDDGSTSTFVIDGVEKPEKAAFPTERVYGPTDRPQIRLITCGGEYDPENRRYLGSVIAYGTLVE